MKHLLVTNDFPPKIGGIQSYLHELWRRLDPDDFAVLTTSFPGSEAFDRAQPFRVDRVPGRVLLPTVPLAERVRRLAAEIGATRVVLDPALPVGALGPSLGFPYTVVLHGAEVSVPGRLPLSRHALAHVLASATSVVAAGAWVASEAARTARGALPSVAVIPPGVDVGRFRPLSPGERALARQHFGVGEEAPVVLSVSRLVPRKGMDVLIRAMARLGPRRGTLLVAGAGRDRKRLDGLGAASGARVRLLGSVREQDLPLLYGAADVFALPCRSRWGGLEQEGFGIVFLEAAAAGVPQVAGRSGGAAEAVEDGETGLVVDPRSPRAVADAIAGLLEDPDHRRELGAAARRRAVERFSYDRLAHLLAAALGTTAWSGGGAAC